MSDFFDTDFGRARQGSLKSPMTWAKDFAFDARLLAAERLRRLTADQGPRQRVLIVGVEVPARAGQLGKIVEALSRSRHAVESSILTMKPQGKFANVDEAIAAAPRPLAAYDWLVITDDDVAVPRSFLDAYLALAQAGDLAISQPAHRFASYASYEITRRRYGSLVRSSRFIEIGPLTVLRADTFSDLIPFPPSRWCYGIDVLWTEIAHRRGWRMGIVDAAPIRHLKPVARGYDSSEAFDEARELMARFDVTARRADVLRSDPLIDA